MSVLLSEHLPLLATAPNGIQKLRGLILELAVRGKLVPQDPNDEPASELLKRIAKERAGLEAEGACKKSKAMPQVGEEDQPFALPAGWKWVRLSEISRDWGQKTPDEPFTYIDVSAIDNTRGKIGVPNVVAPDDAPSRARKLVRRGTVIYSTVRPYLLNIAVIDRDLSPPPIASTAFAILHPLSGLSSQFVFWYLRSPVFIRYVESVQTGIAYPAVNDAQFFSGLFPLPSLAEQHRIVAKVDELMALCDRLEAEQTDAESAHAKLVDTLLGTLTQSADAFELAANWQRLAEHFDTLFTTESSLDALKQTVLQLAVMGKLVPQDPNDEQASELLKRIAKLRGERLANGYPNTNEASTQFRKQEKQSCPEDLASIPDGWTWATLMQCAELVVDCHNKTAPYSSSGIPLLRTSNIRHGSLNLRDLRFVTGETYERWSARCRPQAGDLLITREAPMGEACIIPEDMTVCMGQRMMLVRLAEGTINSRFLLHTLLAPDMMDRVQDKPVGATVEHLRVGGVETLLVPVPPLAEQHRIVAKVDELMALCDRLKADLAESRTRQARLSATLIDSALQVA